MGDSDPAKRAGRELGKAVNHALTYCSPEQMADVLRTIARQLTEQAAKENHNG